MQPIFVQPYLDHIEAAETMSDLKHFFAYAYRHAQAVNDADALARIIAAKDKRKAELAPLEPSAPAVPLPYNMDRLDALRRASIAALPLIKKDLFDE
jgi:hypothetical protein